MTPKERLAHLAYVLRGVPKDRFNLSDWDITSENPEADCGFAGCAVGWATQDAVLQAEGLSMRDRFPRFGTSARSDGWPTVRDFFGVTQRQAEYLFSLAAYNIYAGDLEWTSPPPTEVAYRIEEFLVENRDEEN
jgi:hypothetical protein